MRRRYGSTKRRNRAGTSIASSHLIWTGVAAAAATWRPAMPQCTGVCDDAVGVEEAEGTEETVVRQSAGSGTV